MPYKRKGRWLYVKKHGRWFRWKFYKTIKSARSALRYYRSKPGH